MRCAAAAAGAGGGEDARARGRAHGAAGPHLRGGCAHRQRASPGHLWRPAQAPVHRHGAHRQPCAAVPGCVPALRAPSWPGASDMRVVPRAQTSPPAAWTRATRRRWWPSCASWPTRAAPSSRPFTVRGPHMLRRLHCPFLRRPQAPAPACTASSTPCCCSCGALSVCVAPVSSALTHPPSTLQQHRHRRRLAGVPGHRGGAACVLCIAGRAVAAVCQPGGARADVSGR